MRRRITSLGYQHDIYLGNHIFGLVTGPKKGTKTIAHGAYCHWNHGTKWESVRTTNRHDIDDQAGKDKSESHFVPSFMPTSQKAFHYKSTFIEQCKLRPGDVFR